MSRWGDPSVQATWGAIKNWAEQNKVPDDALVVRDQVDTVVYDLDLREPDGSEPPEFVLMFRGRRREFGGRR
jgi:hypothetical protein